MSANTMIERVRNPPQPAAKTLAISKVGACILPIAEIAVGAVYLDECPRQHYIPIYLVVMGVFGLTLAVLSCLPCSQSKEGESNPLNWLCSLWNALTSVFLFCWFIAGNVWIFSIYEPSYVKNTTDLSSYCHKTLYLFAFWSTLLVYILVGLILFIGCCVLVCLFLCGVADPDDNV